MKRYLFLVVSFLAACSGQQEHTPPKEQEQAPALPETVLLDTTLGPWKMHVASDTTHLSVSINGNRKSLPLPKGMGSEKTGCSLGLFSEDGQLTDVPFYCDTAQRFLLYPVCDQFDAPGVYLASWNDQGTVQLEKIPASDVLYTELIAFDRKKAQVWVQYDSSYFKNGDKLFESYQVGTGASLAPGKVAVTARQYDQVYQTFKNDPNKFYRVLYALMQKGDSKE